MPAPRCKKGSRRCSVSKHCVSKSNKKNTRKCKKGSRKCYNSKCYSKNKSYTSQKIFYDKYGK